MRAVAFLVMVALAVISVLEGELVLALLFAGAKALIIGFGYMELRLAARPHAMVFVAGVVAVTGLLLALVRG